MASLNPLFGGSAFRTKVDAGEDPRAAVLIPFLAGLLFGPVVPRGRTGVHGLNPLFGGSAFRTASQTAPFVRPTS